MKALIENILTALTDDRANQLFQQYGLTPPAVDDIYLGQPDDPDCEFALPAVFVDYNADFTNETCRIFVHVLQDYMQDTDNLSPVRDAGMQHLDFLKVVRHLLRGLRTPPMFGALQMEMEAPVVSDAYYWHTLTLSCVMKVDADTEPKYVMTDGDVDYDVERGRLVVKTA